MLPTLSSNVVEALRLSNQRIVVVGAGGWLGMATLELLHMALGDDAFDSRVVCFGARQRELSLRGGKAVPQRPLDEIRTLTPRPSWLLHLAFLTKDKASKMTEADYVAANIRLSQIILDALDPIGAEGLFVASSGAAYFADDATADPALRLYGSLKRADEAAFGAWAERQSKAAVIARIFNLSGPYISLDKPYALLDFIRCALAGQPIVVRAPYRVERGYVAIRELMSLVFTLLADHRDGTLIFDTGGDLIELYDLAKLVAEIASVPAERVPITKPDANHYVGNDAAYVALRSRYGIEPVSLQDQVDETYTYLAAAS